ncbi:MAG: hypothetical protein HS104_19380 [Polyangiaceae bacterium]|nr:hypothetical protein [Polyangiaceae bacterium]MCE7889980.1 hypothetical protein [Sorangiineae bacterium PRO1]MCL4752520.1 hypothetical protein [Myxococcales bacterium]
MLQLRIIGLVPALLSASLTVACNKEKAGEQAKPAEKTESGCGTDYGDPDKQLCITLPKGYEVKGTIQKSELYSELINIDGPDMGDGVTLTVGFKNSNFKTYEEQLASDEELGSAKLEASGSTPGQSGKWWFTSNGGTKTVSATAKAPNGKAIMCSTSNTTPSAAAIEVCKSLRPFPGK